MAIQAKVKLRGGIEVADAYIRIKAVNVVKKDREGSIGFYATYSAEAFVTKAACDAKADALPVDGELTFKVRNLENKTGLSGALVSDAFGILYADLKAQIVARGWEPNTAAIEDL